MIIGKTTSTTTTTTTIGPFEECNMHNFSPPFPINLDLYNWLNYIDLVYFDSMDVPVLLVILSWIPEFINEPEKDPNPTFWKETKYFCSFMFWWFVWFTTAIHSQQKTDRNIQFMILVRLFKWTFWITKYFLLIYDPHSQDNPKHWDVLCVRFSKARNWKTIFLMLQVFFFY